MNTSRDFFGFNGTIKYIGAVPMPSWICYELANPKWDRVNLNKHSRNGFLNIVRIILLYLKAVLLLKLPNTKKIKLPLKQEHRLIAILNTLNQVNAVTPLLPPSAQVFSIGDKAFGGISLTNQMKRNDLQLIGMKYLPYIMLEFVFTKSSYKRKSIYFFFGHYLAAYGVFRLISENSAFKNKIITYSNDHSALTRPIGLVRDPTIKTIYVPHANVSEQFPPLEMDIAVLYGEDMRQKYQVMNPDINIELIGNPLYDGHQKASLQEIESRSMIGFCVNLLDSQQTVIPYIEALLSLPYTIYFRPHPRDKRNWRDILNNFPTLKFSESQRESTPEYIKKIRVLISGSSSILIDAWAMGVESLQIAISNKNHEDNYGFLNKSEIKLISSPDLLIERLKAPITPPEEIYQRAQFYYVNIGSSVSSKTRFEKIIAGL